MIASQARLKSQLTEKGATLPSATIRTKQATGSTEVQQLPRLRDYAPGTDRMAYSAHPISSTQWQRVGLVGRVDGRVFACLRFSLC